MKAIILAAGYATRLYPLTENQPKALLPIANKPIINYIVEQIEKVDAVDELIVVTNHKFASHFEEWRKSNTFRFGVTVIDDNTTDDSNKLGAVGDIGYVIEKLGIDDEVMIIAGDNIFTFDLCDYYDFYKKCAHDVILVKELDDIEELKRMANAVLDENNKVLDLEEKPENPKTNNAVFAAYIYTKDTVPLIKRYLDEGNNPDAPGFFPSWLYKIKDVYAYKFVGECYDIGTHQSYKEVNEIFSK